MKPLGSFGVQFQQRSPRFILSIFVAGSALFDHRNANARGQFAHGRWKIDMLIFHHEAKKASAHATAETVESLPLWADVKGRRLFLKKRTKRLEIRARAFQWKIGTDHLNDVVRRGDLLDVLCWNLAQLIFRSFGFRSDVKLTRRRGAFQRNEKWIDSSSPVDLPPWRPVHPSHASPGGSIVDPGYDLLSRANRDCAGARSGPQRGRRSGPAARRNFPFAPDVFAPRGESRRKQWRERDYF